VTWAFSVHRPEYVFLAAAKVGGIRSHVDRHAEMLVANLQIQNNVILNAAEYGVKKLLFLGSSCIYPEHAPVPTTEDQLLKGPLQPANEGYALAKIAGLKLCQYLKRERGFKAVSAMPCNLYGPGDNFNAQEAHVIPGMIARMHAAKVNKDPSFLVWGDAKVEREFLYSRDLANALIRMMEVYNEDPPLNVGSGESTDMMTLATLIAYEMKYTGELVFSHSEQGTRKKLLDVSNIRALGWGPMMALPRGIMYTYQDFLTARRK
jgi:GDP-L-fucose synthase